MKILHLTMKEPHFCGSFSFITWEQRKLNEIVFYTSSALSAKDVENDGCYDLYDANSVIGRTNKAVMEQEYITIIKDGAGVGRVRILPAKTAFIGTMGAMTANNSSLLFVYSLLCSADISKKFSGSTIPHIYFKDYGQEQYCVPKPLEQEKIGVFFKQIDNLITLHQCKEISLSYYKFYQNAVPKLPFSWEQRKVGEVSESYSGGTPSVGVKEYYGGQIPFIRSAEINSETTELFLTEEGLENSSARLVAVGDILYALYGATSGEVGRARLKGAINQAILAIKPHTDYDSEYLAQWLRKSKHSIIETYLQGGQGNLSGTIVKELSVDFPSLKEQKAIGDFFRQLDNLITLHQCKCKNKNLLLEWILKYKAIKKMAYDWEQRKFREVGSVSMCRRIFKEQTSENGDIPFYKIGTFGGEADAYISRELFEEYRAKYPYPKKGDILISASGSIGRTVEYTGKNEYFQDSNIVWINHDERLDNSFLKCLYLVIKWVGIEGSTIKRLYNDNILNTTITLPLVPEQKQIGAYFRNLDDLITLHQCKERDFLSVKKCETINNSNAQNTITWEQRKLGDTVQITMGQSPDGSTYSDVPSDYILVQGNADLQNGWVSPRVWTSQMTKKADAGNLIMSVRAPAGAMGKTAYNAVIGRGVAAIKGNEFIYQLLVKMDSDGYWKALSCGSTFESLNSDNIKNADVLIPDVDEQEKIGQYFANLDNLITLHQCVLINFKELFYDKRNKQKRIICRLF